MMTGVYSEERNKQFMQQALKMARKAFERDEVPVGCVIVHNDTVIARAYNQVEHKDTQCAHAELVALQRAGKKLGDWRLLECEIYVTLEPCAMCMHAIRLHRLAGVIYGASSPVFGYQLDKQEFDSLYKDDAIRIVSGIMQDESAQLLKQFFTSKRHKDDK
jgi:tRNA(adenine34) deaminase